MAAHLEEESGVVNVSRNFLATVSSGVKRVEPTGLRLHLSSNTLLACLSGCGSRKADFAARRSLLLGIQSSSMFLEVRMHGFVSSGTSSGRRRESAKVTTGRPVGDVASQVVGNERGEADMPPPGYLGEASTATLVVGGEHGLAGVPPPGRPGEAAGVWPTGQDCDGWSPG